MYTYAPVRMQSSCCNTRPSPPRLRSSPGLGIRPVSIFARGVPVLRCAPLSVWQATHTADNTQHTHQATYNIQHTRHDTTRAKHDTTSASPHLLMGAFVCCGAGMRLKMDEPATLCVGYPLRVYSMLWVSVRQRRTEDWTISVCLKVKVVAGSTRSWPSKEWNCKRKRRWWEGK